MIFSCDVNKANLFFLKTQGKILVKSWEKFEFLYYKGSGENRNGWLLPVEIVESEIKEYLQALFTIDPSPEFILLTEEQWSILEAGITRYFSEYKILLASDEGDWDYIYSVEKMALLPGKNFQKKRNHVSRFLRTYGENWKFDFLNSAAITSSNLSDMQEIYTQWINNHGFEENEFLLSEKKSVALATHMENFKQLQLVAGILYVENHPCAFMTASFTTAECLNVHFEKCLEQVANNGGLAVLNQQFAQAVMKKFSECKFINREEDLNVPGLRKSKMSYYPELLLKKYYGKVTKLDSPLLSNK